MRYIDVGRFSKKFMSKIVESCQFVVDHSSHVRIDDKKLREFSDSFEYQDVKHWIDESPFDISTLEDDDKLHFLLIFNSLSFSYWGDPKWNIEYNSKKLDGAYGLVGAIARAIKNGAPILDAKFLSEISEKDFETFLSGNTQIPLFKERLDIIRDVGATLLNKYNGKLINLVSAANNDAQLLVELLVNNFDSFNDASTYKDSNVLFYKRAQLLTADIFQAFNGKGPGKFHNIDQLTACADYKLPMVLRELGIFNYSDELANLIDSRTEIEAGSNYEVELRANTLLAIDSITKQVKIRFPEIDAIHINDNIWIMSQDKKRFSKPYHLTRTTAY